MPPLVRALRPHQWVKNLFVAAPLLFSRNLFQPTLLARALMAVVVFCAASSAVYLLNDLLDIESDRIHPKKRDRPIASGALSLAKARLVAAILLIGALAAAFFIEPMFAAAIGGYLIINLSYSLALKHWPFVDVLLIAAGFLLRVIGGAYAIAVPASGWLLLCTGLLAAFLGYGKRLHELRVAGGRAGAQRRVLERYSAPPLRVALYGLGVVTVVAYVLYTRAPHTLAYFRTDKLTYTTPFVAFGVGRFLWLVVHRPDAESPTTEMMRDPLFVANLVLWALVAGVVIYAQH